MVCPTAEPTATPAAVVAICAISPGCFGAGAATAEAGAGAGAGGAALICGARLWGHKERPHIPAPKGWGLQLTESKHWQFLLAWPHVRMEGRSVPGSDLHTAGAALDLFLFFFNRFCLRAYTPNGTLWAKRPGRGCLRTAVTWQGPGNRSPPPAKRPPRSTAPSSARALCVIHPGTAARPLRPTRPAGGETRKEGLGGRRPSNAHLAGGATRDERLRPPLGMAANGTGTGTECNRAAEGHQTPAARCATSAVRLTSLPPHRGAGLVLATPPPFPPEAGIRLG